MIFKDKNITLKNGKTAVLKTPGVSDAEKMLCFIKTSCNETDFLSRYPEEWDSFTLEQEIKVLANMQQSDSAMMICCLIDGHVVGSCDIKFRSTIKTGHRAVVGVTVLRDFWGLGIGSAFFSEMIDAAMTRKTEIMELYFEEGNIRGQKLYEKYGFEIMSELPKATKMRDGSYRSLFYMQKELV